MTLAQEYTDLIERLSDVSLDSSRSLKDRTIRLHELLNTENNNLPLDTITLLIRRIADRSPDDVSTLSGVLSLLIHSYSENIVGGPPVGLDRQDLGSDLVVLNKVLDRA